MEAIKLVALDGDDIEVVSMHLQDATLRAGDIRWRPAERRLVVGLDRFDWEGATAEKPAFQRRQAVLRFDRVTACRCKHLDARRSDELLNLLAVSFEPSEVPGGTVTLMFSGGGALRLDVECIEAELVDLGPVREATCCPDHAVDADELAANGRPARAAQG